VRIIFSRKGFDTGSGGKPSPIIDGRPISLPIPATRNSRTTYGDLGLGHIVHQVTKGKLGPGSLCHADPWFAEGQCAFGQSSAAQGHLNNNGVGPGDVFLFFGLYADEHTREVHHRVFGYLKVENVFFPGSQPDRRNAPDFAPDHPHFLGEHDRNNTVYVGPGQTCTVATDALRLTQPDGPLGRWAIPEWIARHGLTYHDKEWRWPEPGTLLSVARGQEFICDVGDDPEAAAWLTQIIAEIDGHTARHMAASDASSPDEVIIAVLRQPELHRKDEQRNDPFYEFGSFGLTGCHRTNLLHPRRAHELNGRRIAFAQGGPSGFRLVYLTPPISIQHHAHVCEVTWPASKALRYNSAPILIDNGGRTDFPALLDELQGGARTSLVGQFASNFRSRKQSVSPELATQLIAGFNAALEGGAAKATHYTDCLPYLPPVVDRRRKRTYEDFLACARGDAQVPKKRRRC
jgi:hypothetical protein